MDASSVLVALVAFGGGGYILGQLEVWSRVRKFVRSDENLRAAWNRRQFQVNEGKKHKPKAW